MPYRLVAIMGALLLGAVPARSADDVAAFYRGRPPDVVIRVFTVVGDATPNWWMGLVIIVVLASLTGWFPQGQGRGGPVGWLKHIIAPAIILGLGLVVAFVVTVPVNRAMISERPN